MKAGFSGSPGIAAMLGRGTIDTFIHNGRGVFGSDFGSCSFVVRNHCNDLFSGSYRRLFEKQGSVADNEELEQRFFTAPTYIARQLDFRSIPGHPIAYWISPQLRKAFRNGVVGQLIDAEGQNKTAENDRFLRLIWEVSINQVGRGKKWLLYAKGGEFRKWYGNIIHVVDWSETARKHYRADSRCRMVDERYWYREGITWTDITSSSISFRMLPKDTTFDMTGPSVFLNQRGDLFYVLGLPNSKPVGTVLSALNPTMHMQLANIRVVPLCEIVKRNIFEDHVAECVEMSSRDWDNNEMSKDYRGHPLLRDEVKKVTVSES